MCDCVKNFSEKLDAHFSQQLKMPAKVSCDSTALFMDDDMNLAAGLKINFTVTADKPGYRKGKATFVRANFCPFCGEKQAKEQGNG